jgi:hypothetical protein
MSLSRSSLNERPIGADIALQAGRSVRADAGFTEMTVEGTVIKVPCAQICDRPVIAMRSWLTIAKVKDEEWWDGEAVPAPKEFVAKIQRVPNLGADIFTFGETLAAPQARYDFPHEQESIAAIRTNSFADWWNNRVSSDLRKDVRRAAKRGVEVRCVPFTDDFVRGIKEIYDESPIRQGRKFWHYNKCLEEVKRANATYLERSSFLGAFCGDELVGFVKIVFVNRLARFMQIIAKEKDRDKRPMNALIARAVELAEANGSSYLTYGHYRYPQGADSLTAFKHRNGFEEIMVPRYYVPLTAKGSLALRLRLHHGLKALIPGSLLQQMKQIRTRLYQ